MRTYHGSLPHGWPPGAKAVVLDGRHLGFITWGSGSCSEIPTTVTRDAAGTYAFGLHQQQGQQTCTLDESTTGVVVELSGVALDTTHPLRIVLHYSAGADAHLTARPV